MRVSYPKPKYSQTTVVSLALGMVALIFAFIFAVLGIFETSKWATHVAAGLFITAAMLMMVWINTAERDQASRKNH